MRHPLTSLFLPMLPGMLCLAFNPVWVACAGIPYPGEANPGTFLFFWGGAFLFPYLVASFLADRASSASRCLGLFSLSLWSFMDWLAASGILGRFLHSPRLALAATIGPAVLAMKVIFLEARDRRVAPSVWSKALPAMKAPDAQSPGSPPEPVLT